MTTQINGKAAPWTPDIWAKWHTFADVADPKLTNLTVMEANYFKPRPYVDEYNRGSRDEGFTFVWRTSGRFAEPHVSQTIVRRHARVGGDD
jgi:hypothetical protein